IIDLWYSFVYTGGDIEIFTTLNGSLSDSRLAVWDGCPAVPGNYCDQAGYSDLAGACATSVCSYDAWCCSNSWDSICAGEAATDANCAYCLTPLGGGAVIACNDDFIGLASDIYISCPTLTVGNTYYIQAGGFNANTGSFDLTINNYDIFGCNDAAACNYNACATVDDGSCTYPGCTDPAACNYDALAGCDDGSCYYPDGCTDPAACNYNPAALCDDGSCYYPDGCTDPAACNWNPAAICDDGSCDYSCYGCTDPTACNFDGGATIDDGSCTYPPCIANDVPGGAIGLPITMLGSCSLTSVDLSGASDSPESQASGNDLWYSFVAVTSGARIEAHDVSGQDVHVELFDGGMSSVSYENVVGGNGDEYLNVGNLTAGNTYWVSVTGSAMVDVCIQWIPDTRCDYGPGPYNLCSTFKADWVGSNGYTFYFTSTTTLNTYSKYQASPTPGTFCVLSTVPGLTWGDTYDVLISSNWTLSTGSGSESVEVLGDESCSVIVNPQPLMVLRPSDNCANFGPHLLGQTVAAQPFVCAAIDFEWEFTRTDVPELAFTHLRGAANRFLNLNTVPGLVAGATYDVRIRPIFSSGPGAYGAADCLSIVGVGGAAEQVVDNQQAETERLDVSEIASLIYPNPNTGEMVNINLNGIESETVKVRIMDGIGKVVFERTYSVEGSLLKQITFDNPLAAGSYTVNMIAGDVIRTEKMMVQR
ncbi:MAG: T9SS type A sorting domain-containing protein, partial [Flavobacteriales bacterium]|nr:T9SS type A sorting domain-containing protein [Flavobacteriales bacterium]